MLLSFCDFLLLLWLMSISFLDLLKNLAQERGYLGAVTGAPQREPGVAGKTLKGVDRVGWARAVGSHLPKHTPLQLLTVARPFSQSDRGRLLSGLCQHRHSSQGRPQGQPPAWPAGHNPWRLWTKGTQSQAVTQLPLGSAPSPSLLFLKSNFPKGSPKSQACPCSDVGQRRETEQEVHLSSDGRTSESRAAQRPWPGSSP